MAEGIIIRRADEIAALKKIIPLARAGKFHHQQLAMNFYMEGWKDLFIRFWQQDERSVAELVQKLRELGGEIDRATVETIHTDVPKDATDPVLSDKTMLLRCVNQKNQILVAYADARRNPMSFDNRMLFQRHQLQARETLEHLTTIYLSYPSRLSSAPLSSIQLSHHGAP